ncbi:reverse transcriptase domain-containing protein [Tanacetum coccineum]
MLSPSGGGLILYQAYGNLYAVTEKKQKGRPDTKSKKTKLSCKWKLYTDGAASSDGSGAGLMLIDLKGKEYTYALRFRFETKNNEAEYEALLAGLRIAQDIEIVCLAIFVDFQLLVNQIKGTYAAEQPTIREYLQKTKEQAGFDDLFEHLTKEVLVKVLSKRSIEEKEILQVETKEEESWMTPIHEYLEQSAIRKIAENSVITAGSVWSFSHWGVNILGPFPIAPGDAAWKLMNISMSNWLDVHTRYGVDDIAQILWVHRTLPRNSQKETPFSLTYGSESIIPIFKNNFAKDDRGRIKEVDKRREIKEVASIEEAYYRNKLRMHHNERSGHSTYMIGDFVLLSQNNTRSP